MNHVQLAKLAIKDFVINKNIVAVPEDLPPEFYKKKHGVFVSLHKGKELRGCIGTYLPTHENMAEEIIQNAIAAGSRDNRFPPLSTGEISDLSVEVSLLSEPEKISGIKELDLKKYGVIVKCPDGRCGLLLPDLEGIESVEQQISIACQKGGINPILDKDLDMYKFTVKKYAG